MIGASSKLFSRLLGSDNTILLNLLRALPDGGLEAKVTETKPC